MSMTKKDFVVIAQAIKEVTNLRNNTEDQKRIVEELAQHLAWTLERSNPNFNRHTFLVACGVESK